MTEKIRILAWGDYCCATGFGTVMGNLMRELHATGRYDIDVVGINYGGDPYDAEQWPGRVFPAMQAMNSFGNYADVFGRQRVLDLLATGTYDVLFMLQDTFIVRDFMDGVLDTQKQLSRKFKIVYYYPLDATPQQGWITEVVSKVDFPVTYTQYAKSETLKVDPSLEDKLQVIYHGTNTDDFHHIEDREAVASFRHDWFKGAADGKFLLVNVNRNQGRKDIARSFAVLAELKRLGMDDVFLYMHMQVSDVGGNLLLMAEQYGLELEKDWSCPSPKAFSANQGFSVEYMNWLYNAADAVITTTLGEGWGLSVTEAMATKTPVIAPNHTSLSEILADHRGLLVKAGSTPSQWIVKENDNDRLRPLMSVGNAAAAITHYRAGVEKIALEHAYDFVRQYTWKHIAEQWLPVIDTAAQAARAETAANVPQAPNREQRRANKRR